MNSKVKGAVKDDTQISSFDQGLEGEIEQSNRKDELSFATMGFNGTTVFPRDILQGEGFSNLKFRKQFAPGKMSFGVICIYREGY